MSRPIFCDGSYDGLLSALFEAHRRRPMPDAVLMEKPEQTSLFEEAEFIPTQPGRAQRLQRAIDCQLGPSSATHVQMLHTSFLPDAGTMLLHYLNFGWQVGRHLDEYMTHPAVLPVHRISRRVALEIHRLSGLVRFSPTEQGVLYAALEPDYRVVPPLALHFQDRLTNQNWILHDLRHHQAAFYKPGELRIVYLPSHIRPRLSDDPYEKLWQTFYDAIAIQHRLNPKLRRSHMPARYHQHLPEMQRTRQ